MRSGPSRAISRLALAPCASAPPSPSTSRFPMPKNLLVAAERTCTLIFSNKFGRIVVRRGADDLHRLACEGALRPHAPAPQKCLGCASADRDGGYAPARKQRRGVRSRSRRRQCRGAQRYNSTLGLFRGHMTFAQLWYTANGTV
ncbi:hypothetical protein EDB85DRAFT_819198 [Lactarius pseudohatsudake]|nr:hypothetical protein EDB85DRAFT_1197578 [Lactarius pseudohatsudake]KAH9035874.1 hypothetical protein EDB85DRAFT_819198 [Lactarius pseudohatsudake]